MKGLLCFFFSLAAAVAQPVAPDAPAPKSQVFFAMDNTSVGPVRTINARTVQRMVDSLVCQLTGQSTVAQAWLKLVVPTDIVGIKVAAAGQAVSGTNPEVVEAIASGLIQAGFSPKNIIVWDRNLDDLLAAGYKQKSQYYTLQSVDPRTGYDPKAQVTAPVIGKLIWGDSQFGKPEGNRLVDILSGGDQLSSRSFYAKVLTTGVTKVINVPSLTDSFMTGVNGGIVNMTLANVDNWRRFSRSSSEGDSYLAEIYADPMVHDKVVLTILDGLILQFAGGPFPNPNFLVDNFTLFASRDVVAIDSVASRLIDESRAASRMPSVRAQISWLDAAVQLGLGQADEPRIEMVRVGVH